MKKDDSFMRCEKRRALPKMAEVIIGSLNLLLAGVKVHVTLFLTLLDHQVLFCFFRRAGKPMLKLLPPGRVPANQPARISLLVFQVIFYTES